MADTEIEKKLIGKEISGCEIISKIASGGMGSVFKARHKALDRIVCVKILSPALANDQKAVSLFLTEARAIAELDNPNIVNVFNVGREQGLYFIVMAFINGDTLSNIVKRRPVLPISFLTDVFIGILKGLSAAHEKGIIHRDIKPSNILINEKLEPKIVDFGIAKKVEKDKNTTKTTEMAGTAYFIAPEQALGRDIDVRADLYSLGATLYFALTAKFPYMGKNAIDIIQQHINSPIPNPAALRKDTPLWLSNAVQKLMAKAPKDRFQSAGETIDYITKMRAEDQLRVNLEGNSTLDIGTEMGLRVRKDAGLAEEPQNAVVLETQRAAAPVLQRVKENAATDTLHLPVVDFGKKAEPVNIPERKYARPLTEQMGEVGANLEKEGAAMRWSASRIPVIFRKLFFHMPGFIIFSLIMAFSFFKMGALAGRAAEDALSVPFLNALTQPFYGLVAGQAPFVIIAAFCIITTFALLGFKLYSRFSIWLWCLGACAYLFGFYAADAGISVTLGTAMADIFAKDYSLIFVICALLFCINNMWDKTSSKIVRALTAVLAAVCVACVANFASLDVPPASAEIMTLLKYASILLVAACVAVVALKNSLTNSILPILMLVAASGLMWGYEVSGKYYSDKELLVPMAAEAVEQQEEAARKAAEAKERRRRGRNRRAEEQNFLLDTQAVTVFGAASTTRAERVRSKESLSPEEKSEMDLFKKEDINKYYIKVYEYFGTKALEKELFYSAVEAPLARLQRDQGETLFYPFAFLIFLFVTNFYFIIYLLGGEEA